MRRPDPVIVVLSCAVIALVVVARQQLNPAPTPTTPYAASHAACTGEPIAVSYPYKGNPEQPHACQVQCDTQRVHYILYTNGLGTQCDALPYCNDRGEDDGVTCDPPTHS